MPWTTPSLTTVRQNNRDYIVGKLQKPLIPNDYPRVLADANGGNAHLNLQYLDWLATQLLPDTAEKQFLDKWANIFLINADGSRGRKIATYASGTASIVGTVAGTLLPQGAQFSALSGSDTLTFQTTATSTIATSATSIAIRSLNAGAAANLAPGSGLTLASAIPGIDSSTGLVVALSGGTDEETDDELRVRVLARIRQPPMGGDADDYVNWALQVAGVTRAWCAPGEMGFGTVSVRFMCDDLRATNDPMTNGFPLPEDVAAVQSYIDSVRPVSVRDFFALAPIPQPVSFAISNLSKNSVATQAAIAASVTATLKVKARPAYAKNGVLQPAQTIAAAWISAAISAAAGVTFFDLTMADAAMANNGCMGVLGTITYD